MPGKEKSSDSLMLSKCLVASRHLDVGTRASVVPKMQKLAEEIIYKDVHNPAPSPQSILAVLIVSMWSPVDGHPQTRDPRLVITSGVSMALNLRLNHSIDYVASLQKFTNSSDLENATENARLVRLKSSLLIVQY